MSVKVLFYPHPNKVMVGVTMCNHREERDVGLMLMKLSKIPRGILDRFEENYDREVSSPMNTQLTGMLKQRYIGLKVVRLLKSLHREFDEAWNRKN